MTQKQLETYLAALWDKYTADDAGMTAQEFRSASRELLQDFGVDPSAINV